jgi:hypothetical protein
MKFTAFALLATLTPALAFVPSSPMSSPKTLPLTIRQGSLDPAPVDDAPKSRALPFAEKPDNLNGELVGDVGFDPFKFTDSGDIEKFRKAELKHGRVCMLATTGVIVQELYQLNENFPSKNFLEAVKTAPALGIFQIVVAILAIELRTENYEGRVPGDIGFDPLRLSVNGIRDDWALAELKHGRLAMIGFLGMLVQALLSDKPILEQTFTWANSF